VTEQPRFLRPFQLLNNKETMEQQARCQNENETKFESNVTDMEEFLDTYDIADRVKRLKDRLGILGARFYKTLELSKSIVFKLLNYPAPWNTLTNVKKMHYTNLNAWLIENEGKPSPKHLVRSNKSFQVKRCVEEDGNGSLDTVNVAAKITALLRKHSISHGSFAKKKLSIPGYHFDHLVTRPTPWAELNESDKAIFRRIFSWTQQSFSKFVELKLLIHFSKSRDYRIRKN
jgi:hypothetical protein